jgi:xanthine dehydrogenase small subunit
MEEEKMEMPLSLKKCGAIDMRKKIVFYLNGERKEVGAKEASLMLSEYLRYGQDLTGTKVVCAEGDCGACSVLRYFPHVKGRDYGTYQPVNSCISLVAQLDGSSLVTVEALKKNDELHPVQKAMVSCHGSQCGFCTPGFVMAITGLVEEKLEKKEKTIKKEEAKNCMTGNLCRCTGYAPIIDAALSIDVEKTESIKKRFYSERQEVDLIRSFSESVLIEEEGFLFFAPKTLKEAVDFLIVNPDARILGAGTDLGVVHNKRKIELTKLLSLHLVTELYQIKHSGNEISLGARVTHTEFRHFLKKTLPEFANYLDIFASPQIKNVATIVGNIANASPIGDTPPALLVLNAEVEILGAQGSRVVPLSKFFLAYRKTDLKHGEIITGIKFILPEKESSLAFYKNSTRKDLDISALNFAIKVDWADPAKQKIKDISIAAGGVAATPLRFFKTEDFLKTKFDIDGAVKILHSEFTPLSDVRASAAYRRVVMENYFRRFFEEVK